MNFNNRPGGRAPFREKRDKEFEEKVLEVARVARVVAGGKRFRFRAAVAIGDKKGRVGFGLGKGADVAQSVAKAVHQAKKGLVRVPIVNGTIPFEIKVKYNSAVVFLKPAPPGRGINAGGAIRVVSELAGIKDIIGKVISRSGNKINNARATLKALGLLMAKNHQS
ncbi:MAG: 30S ribosomal protein S5 [Parcubacteria group bacterium]|nr:30S ribosomal protein S5 [Parcubacteria group bacterium]